MTTKIPITVAYGDGIGPEIMKASLSVLLAAGAQLDIETIEIGEQVYLRGNTSGIAPSSWDSLRRTKVFYKAPITTPQGGGYKSLNVTIRKSLGLYANVRPCASYYPAIDTKHPLMDLIIIRENEEDLYAGIEHRQTNEVYQTLKLITRPGTERVVRFAFEYARANNRRKVTCFTKDNIMKFTDGLFHKIFDEIAAEYPDLENEHWIIDIGAAKIADQPEQFDVVVLPNLYGDIISDVTAQLSGSVGLGVSSNVGETFAMFEAIHGSAPDIAGRGIANPSGLLLAAIPMLVHIGQPDVAEAVHNAWKRTIEEGIHTADIYREGRSKTRANTGEFAEAIIERLGQRPQLLRPVTYVSERQTRTVIRPVRTAEKKALVGVDVFIDWDDNGNRNPTEFGDKLRAVTTENVLSLHMVTNRGQKVYPGDAHDVFCTDHWRCRFTADGKTISHTVLLDLLSTLEQAGYDFIKMENLYTFNGQPGYSLGQGE